ncbi:MAG: prephenate dehydratase domain-containing protein, partial [Acidobacteriota bacterium]
MIVGFQGEPGAYSEIAASRVGRPLGFRSFTDVFQAIVDNQVQCGALPLENSLGGSIHENYDLLLKYPVTIVAETYLRIEHCLLGLPSAKLATA